MSKCLIQAFLLYKAFGADRQRLLLPDEQFPSSESTGPKNTSSSSSAHAIRGEALRCRGSHGLWSSLVAVTAECLAGAQRLLLERRDGRALLTIGCASTATPRWCALAADAVIGWLLQKRLGLEETEITGMYSR
jgi:hypothetical protein